MKRVLALVGLCAAMSFATTSVSVGSSPSHGMIGVEQTFKDDKLGANIHLNGLKISGGLEAFVAGLGLVYRFNGLTGPYAFHASDWIHNKVNNVYGEGENEWRDKRTINYWRLLFGFGYQHMFFKRLGAYFEVGSGFYAGDGGYYLHYDSSVDKLNNNDWDLHSGFGLKVSF